MKNEVLERAISFIDSWLQYRYERLELPGFVVAIAHNGDMVFNKAFGYANLERAELMRTDHVFRIASHSKTFTATSLMQLAEQQVLHIDDPIIRHIPWLRDHPDSRMTKITVRQLMSHSAGMIRDGIDSNYWELTTPFPDLPELKRQLLRADLIFDNNTKMKYSNFGYALLGCLIEEVSGMPFNIYTQQKIIQPLNLCSTGPEFTDEIAPLLVTGYTRRSAEKHRLPITNYIDTRAMSSATGFYSTASDMCKYFQAHFAGSDKLLSDESKKEMQRLQWRLNNSKDNEAYGLGFAIDCFGKREVFGHGGGFPGQRTKTFCDSEAKLVVVVLTNCIDGDPRAMGKGIIASIIDHFERSAEQSDAASIDELRRFQGRFMNLWSEINIVESGRKLIAIDPNTWAPFSDDQNIQSLERIDDRTLRITSSYEYYSEGEIVKYDFDDTGTVKSLVYAGADMLPEAAFNSTHARKRLEAALKQGKN